MKPFDANQKAEEYAREVAKRFAWQPDITTHDVSNTALDGYQAGAAAYREHVAEVVGELRRNLILAKHGLVMGPELNEEKIVAALDSCLALLSPLSSGEREGGGG